MDTRIKRMQRDYTMAFKLAVVGQVERGDHLMSSFIRVLIVVFLNVNA